MSISNEEEAAAVAAKMLPPRRLSTNREESGSFSDDASGASGDYDLTHLPPGRMNAVKGHHRLHGSGSNLASLMDSAIGSGTGTPRSRSRSPSLMGRRDGGSDNKISSNTTTTHDANSSISSLDDYDSDILTDRAGTLDELSESQRKLHGSFKELHLPATVMERMSEDTLEDSHAFSDVVRCFSSNASRVSHVSGSNAGDGMLEPLDECDEGLEENSSLEEDPDDDFVLGDPDGNGGDDLDPDNPHHHAALLQTVILTNMENLTLDAAASGRDDHSNLARTGESSTAYDQPTA
jgi:hypothetical protein